MKKATIQLYGYIPSYRWLAGGGYEVYNTADSFAKQLAALEADDTVDEIALHIHSGGGSVFEGLGMVNAIQQCSKKVVAYNDGLAASMAAVILLAADEAVSGKASLLMTHRSSTVAWGNREDLEQEAKMLQQIDTIMAELAAEKMGTTAEEAANQLFKYQDTWLSPTAALHLGLIDRIDGKASAKPTSAATEGLPSDNSATAKTEDQSAMNPHSFFGQMMAAMGLTKQQLDDANQRIAQLEAQAAPAAQAAEPAASEPAAEAAEPSTTPADVQASLQQAQEANAALKTENAALTERVAQLEASLTEHKALADRLAALEARVPAARSAEPEPKAQEAGDAHAQAAQATAEIPAFPESMLK